MNTSNNNTIKVVYEALENKTYEFLGNAVINASINGNKLGLSDTIMRILPVRYYDGQKYDNNAEIGFGITVFALNPTEPTGKIIMLIDGERLEIELLDDCIHEKGTCKLSPEEIIGLDRGAKISLKNREVNFTLQPADIKRIADAKNVGIYIDSYDLYNVNGGEIKFNGNDASFQIEGIQGVMKRVYHYFVDENCYSDYCSLFLENKQKLLESEQQWEEEQKRINELIKERKAKRDKEDEENWYKVKKKNVNIIIASVVFILFCIIIGWDTWLATLAFVVVLVCGFRLFSIGAIGGGNKDNKGE